MRLGGQKTDGVCLKKCLRIPPAPKPCFASTALKKSANRSESLSLMTSFRAMPSDFFLSKANGILKIAGLAVGFFEGVNSACPTNLEKTSRLREHSRTLMKKDPSLFSGRRRLV